MLPACAYAARQVGLEFIDINRIVDEQGPIALIARPLHNIGEHIILLVVRANPAEPYAERDAIGAHGGRGLHPDPPGRQVIAAMFLRMGPRAA
jgi:hypothetical protein